MLHGLPMAQERNPRRETVLSCVNEVQPVSASIAGNMQIMQRI